MRDLKHLLYFEDLLQEANNALIAQARDEGKVCVAYTCENVPEPLLNLPGCFSVRLHAPHTGSMDIATYYMTNLLCEPSRALLERAIEGGFNFADCVITPDGCTMMNRAVENMELLKTMGKDNPNFFHEYMEIAFKNTESDVELAVLQCTNHILTPLHEKYGIDIHPHLLRHSFASFCAEAGVPKATLLSILGTESEIADKYYTHVSDESQRKAIEVISNRSSTTAQERNNRALRLIEENQSLVDPATLLQQVYTVLKGN